MSTEAIAWLEKDYDRPGVFSVWYTGLDSLETGADFRDYMYNFKPVDCSACDAGGYPDHLAEVGLPLGWTASEYLYWGRVPLDKDAWRRPCPA